MNVLFLTEAGKDIGLGHLSRCRALAYAFAKRGHDARITVAGDETVWSSLNKKERDTGTVQAFKWYNDFEGLKIMCKYVHVIVVDSYLASEKVYRVLSEDTRVPVFLDDTVRLKYPPSVVLNWSISAKSLPYPSDQGITYLLGTQYVALREGFIESPNQKFLGVQDRGYAVPFREKGTGRRRHETNDLLNVLITFGGDDSKNMTPRVLEFLVKQYPQIEKHVVIGSAYNNIKEIESFADANTHFVHSPGDVGMCELMSRCDLAICSGGQTLYELAYIGVPAVAVMVAENQRANVEGFEKAGFIENAGFWTQPDIMERIGASFSKMIDIERRSSAIKVGQSLVKGDGAFRVAEEVEKLYKQRVGE